MCVCARACVTGMGQGRSAGTFPQGRMGEETPHWLRQGIAPPRGILSHSSDEGR